MPSDPSPKLVVWEVMMTQNSIDLTEYVWSVWNSIAILVFTAVAGKFFVTLILTLIHVLFRRDCFKNEVFTDCITALMLKDEHPKLDKFVNELYG